MKTKPIPKGFISVPTLDQLKLTPKEIAALKELVAWQEQSAKSTMIFGPSIHCSQGHQNNPNNYNCWICGQTLA